MCECLKGKKCYTVVFGKITESEVVNETPKGYRVKNGKFIYEHMVYKLRIYSGWLSDAERYFYTEKTVLNYDEALKICRDQIMCMENYYTEKLNKIQNLKNGL